MFEQNKIPAVGCQDHPDTHFQQWRPSVQDADQANLNEASAPETPPPLNVNTHHCSSQKPHSSVGDVERNNYTRCDTCERDAHARALPSGFRKITSNSHTWVQHLEKRRRWFSDSSSRTRRRATFSFFLISSSSLSRRRRSSSKAW